jgi:myo-inositol-1(or 4)-monophosphatase
MISVESRLEVAKLAARKAGCYLKEQFGSGNAVNVNFKGEINIVTPCDLEAEQLIVDMLHAAYPEDDIIAEEDRTSDWTIFPSNCWIVDPLDGTTNFAHGFPHFCVSIAYQTAGEVSLGVVYAPVLDEIYYATRAGGAFLDQVKINVSGISTLKDSVVASGFPYDLEDAKCDNLREWSALTRRIRSPRCVGAAALDLCYVACGRLDAHWELDLDVWDIAAGSLIVAEAGGRVTDAQGNPFNLQRRSILASNPELHGQILAVLADPVSEPRDSSGQTKMDL